MKGTTDIELQGAELWRRQCARHLMDCYGLAMEAAVKTGGKEYDDLVRLMVEGMTAVRGGEDERPFYRMTAKQCRVCSGTNPKSEQSRLFRIYAAIFEDLSQGGRMS